MTDTTAVEAKIAILLRDATAQREAHEAAEETARIQDAIVRHHAVNEAWQPIVTWLSECIDSELMPFVAIPDYMPIREGRFDTHSYMSDPDEFQPLYLRLPACAPIEIALQGANHSIRAGDLPSTIVLCPAVRFELDDDGDHCYVRCTYGDATTLAQAVATARANYPRYAEMQRKATEPMEPKTEARATLTVTEIAEIAELKIDSGDAIGAIAVLLIGIAKSLRAIVQA